MVQFVCRYHQDSAFYPGEHQHLQKPCIKALDVCLAVSQDQEILLFPRIQTLALPASWKFPSSAGGAQHGNAPWSASAPSELSVPTRLKERGYSPLRATTPVQSCSHPRNMKSELRNRGRRLSRSTKRRQLRRGRPVAGWLCRWQGAVQVQGVWLPPEADVVSQPSLCRARVSMSGGGSVTENKPKIDPRV